MAEDINPTAIRTDQLDEILENNPTIITDIIERFYPATRLKQEQQFVPVVYDGRNRAHVMDRLVSGGLSKDIDGVYSLIGQAINDKLTRERISAADRPIYTEDFNPENFRAETITASLISREPGTTSQGKHMNQGRQEWRPSLREMIDDPDHPNKKLRIYGQWFDNVIELCCWARTNKTANYRALWLERLMEDYMWFFKYEGVSGMRFNGRLADGFEDIGDNSVHSRRLRYYVRTERITTVSEFVVKEILLKVFAAETLGE